MLIVFFIFFFVTDSLQTSRPFVRAPRFCTLYFVKESLKYPRVSTIMFKEVFFFHTFSKKRALLKIFHLIKAFQLYLSIYHFDTQLNKVIIYTRNIFFRKYYTTLFCFKSFFILMKACFYLVFTDFSPFH